MKFYLGEQFVPLLDNNYMLNMFGVNIPQKCNLTCAYCYETHKIKNRIIKEVSKQELNFIYKNIMNEVVDRYNQHKYLLHEKIQKIM